MFAGVEERVGAGVVVQSKSRKALCSEEEEVLGGVGDSKVMGGFEVCGDSG